MTPRRVLYAAVLVILVVLASLIIVYREPLKQALGPVAEFIRESPYGYAIIATGVFITSFPPLVGYSSLVTFSGFLFGFPLGFIPVAIGSWLGAISSFLLIRHFNLRRLVERFTANDHRYTALEEAVEEGGFGILLMIRLSPFPQPAVNGFFAIVPKIRFGYFALASFLAVFKLLIDIWIGSKIGQVADPDDDPKTHYVSYLTLAGGIAVLILTMWWIYQTTMKRVKVLAKRHEQRLQTENDPLLNEREGESEGERRGRGRTTDGYYDEV